MATFSSADERYMSRALALAQRGRGHTRPNPMVGAVLVRDGIILGEGYHRRAGGPHAEIEAIRSAHESLEGATLYVTLEPCCHQGKTPPCTDAILELGLSRVVVAMKDPNPEVQGKGISALKSAGLKVSVGLLGDKAARLNEAFCTYHTMGRPFVVTKWAMSLDGRTSTDLGESKWISNAVARQHVHQMRALMDAVMVGIGTVVRDDPELTVRLPDHEGPQPIRIVVDGHLKIGPNARLLNDETGGKVLIATSQQASTAKRDELRQRGHEVIVVDSANRRVDLVSLMRELHARGIQSVLLEGGRQLAASMFAEGLVDKLVCFLAPKVLGGRLPGGPLLGWGTPTMDRALKLTNISIRQFGDNVCLEGRIQRPRPIRE
jgi:diaminohydroxyphosphoribosylaminopyrimidine deaminase/5-amino-6-(5-phosphoribosylamino)uracil reductase